MGYWVYMLCMALVLPVIMLLFGKRFMHKPPKEINDVYGYRTPMSTKNKDTWEFAHRHNGKLWYVCGWWMLVASFVVMLTICGAENDVVGVASGILCGLQVLVMLGTIVSTECALRKHFHKDGTRK